MSDPDRFTLEEAHRHFGKTTNGRVWELLEKEDRSKDEDDEMVAAAYTSYYHWSQVGTAVNLQRGHWMISRVFMVLEQSEPALVHAQRCMELTEAHPDLMEDFDVAFAHEALAHAYALCGETSKARKLYSRAVKLGEQIADEEDRSIFMGDLRGGKWYDAI
jgi:hypothetical protein